MDMHWSFFEGSALPITLVAGIVLVIYCFYKNKSLPPGPWGLPYLGYWPFMKKENLHLQLENLIKKYGKVYSFTVTGRLFIHLGSIKALKAAHITNADSFRQRCQAFTPLNYVYKQGVVCQNGDRVKVLRKFFISTFKEWVGSLVKNNTFNPVTAAMESITENLRSKKGKVVNILELVTDQFSIMFHTLLFGNELLTSKEIKTVTNNFKNIIPYLVESKQLLVGDFAKHVILPLIPGNSSFVKDLDSSSSILKKVVRRHVETFDPNNTRNLLDSFLKERHDRRQKGDSTAEYFTEDTLVYSLIQFTGDAILDSSLLPGYIIKALICHPEEQEKIYEELMEVVGPNRQPLLVDRYRLPYITAFIWEVVRIDDFFTLVPSLECTRDTVINGYKIPKGSITVVNSWAAQHDEQSYKDPYMFNPSRFLSKPGKVKESLPVIFGVGKRACGGEEFVLTLMFTFVSTIVYNFKLSTPDKVSTDTSVGNRVLNICFKARSDN